MKPIKIFSTILIAFAVMALIYAMISKFFPGVIITVSCSLDRSYCP